MSTVDLDCIKSEYGIGCGCCGEFKDHLLRLGRCHEKCFETGLFFHLPACGCFHRIKQARLFLFKEPLETCCCRFENLENSYCAYPLLEFFESGCCLENPRYDENMYVEFRDNVCDFYTEIDITKLVNAWANGLIDNKGILLKGCRGDLVTYASVRHREPGMKPFVRIAYEESKPWVSMPCEVSVV